MQLGYDPEYVLDKMDMVEARVAIKYSYYAHKDEWESQRLVAFLIAQTNSRKKLKLEDIIKLPWDANQNEIKEYSLEERQKLEARAEALKKVLFLEDGKQ